MSTEVFTPRSFSVSARDVSSTYSYSSSEASSRLAARLERSEYKRSRGKQRLNYYNSARNQSKRREIKGGRRKHQPSSATTRTESEEDGVTSIWEVHRQKPYYYTDRLHSLPLSKVSPREHPKSWYGIPNVNPENKHTRPRSTHDTPSDGRNISPISNQLRLFGKPEERLNSTEPNFSSFLSYQEDFQQKHTVHREISHDTEGKYSDIHSYPDKETPCSEPNQYHTGHNRSVNKKGMYLSRSLSSSFSSQVGSSDEKEDSQGIYSAYDVASRSPFESMVSQRYSQSSLSSSNASWPHSSSSLNYNVRDIPPLLDPPIERQHNRSDTEHQRSATSHYDSHFRDNFSIIKENPQKCPPPVPPKPTKYSSSYSIHLHSATSGTNKDPIHHNLFSEKMGLSPPKGPTHQNQQPSQIKDYFKDPLNCLPISKMESNKGDGKGPSVREIAKKFTPCSVRHISSEILKTHSEDDAHRVKVDGWPKVMSVIPQESSPTFETAAVEDVPPARPPYPNDKIYNFKSVTMRQKDEKCRNAEEIASHRLSLQELIKLHEEQIAIQAKSAKTIFVHAYFKRSPSDVESGQTKFDFSKELKTAQHETVSPLTVINKQPSVDNSYKTPKSQMARHEHPGYEVREVDVSQSSPFKVIEITDKATGSTKERTSRLKRHRTIGIVGYRHQIDRTAGEKVPTKQKRHTTVGIVCDFKDATQSESKAEVSPGFDSHEDERVLPNKTFGQETELIAIPVDKERREEPRKHIPVKVYDIETRQEPQKYFDAERSGELKEAFEVEKEDWQVEDAVVSLSADYLCSSFPGKDLPEENYVPALGFSSDQRDSFDTSSPAIEHQQSSAHSPNYELLTSTLNDTPTRNTHSPVVELLPNRRGKATSAFYKTVSYSTPTTEKTSTCTSDKKQKLPSDEHVFYQTKPYAIPVAQVSPVSQDLETQEIIQAQPVEVTSPPPPEPPSALEMYETRLAMWNLLPSQERASRDETEHYATENQLLGDKSKHSQSMDRCRVRSPPVHQDTTTKGFNNVRGSKFSSNLHSPLKTQEYYLGVIGRLNEENCRLKEKSEAEKREFHRMYQEQKKVANAYQKLEDRYRRRVHELQDALANCTCQGNLINEKSTKSLHVTNSRSDRESQSSKTQSSKGGMRMFEELEEWLTEQSHNTKTAKVNATSRDSLISSSSDLTGTGWDDHCDMRDVNIDQVNGTHV